jgi:hypothetical protein
MQKFVKTDEVTPGSKGRQQTISLAGDDVGVGIGNVANTTMSYNSTRKATVWSAQGTPIEIHGLNMAKDRWELVERFIKLPQLSAVTQLPASNTYSTPNFLANQGANHDFEVLGTNAASADVTTYVEGGLAVATHGAANDSTILLPHLTAANNSPWKTVTWGTDQQVRWECCLQTPAAVTTIVIWAGLKLTNTPVVATDDDQTFFIFDTSASGSTTMWHAIQSIGGTDIETVCTGIGAVAAATNYHLAITFDSSRIARFYINGDLQYTGVTALTNTTDLIPYIGIKDLADGTARTMYVFKQAISRKSGA